MSAFTASRPVEPTLLVAVSHLHHDGRVNLRPQGQPPVLPHDVGRLWVAGAIDSALVLTSSDLNRRSRRARSVALSRARIRLPPSLRRAMGAPCPVALIGDRRHMLVVANLNHPHLSSSVLHLVQRICTDAGLGPHTNRTELPR